MEQWKLTDQEIAHIKEISGDVSRAQEAKRQAFINAGGTILNPDALPDLYEACKYALWATQEYLKQDEGNWREFTDTLNKAIAKVEGG